MYQSINFIVDLSSRVNTDIRRKKKKTFIRRDLWGCGCCLTGKGTKNPSLRIVKIQATEEVPGLRDEGIEAEEVASMLVLEPPREVLGGEKPDDQ